MKAAFKRVLLPGGPLTVTDANLALGRLLPSFFPKIFGPGENEPLSLEETMKHFRHLTQEINVFLSSSQALIFTQIPRRASIFFWELLMMKLMVSCFPVFFEGECKWGQPLTQQGVARQPVRDERGGGCHGIHSCC